MLDQEQFGIGKLKKNFEKDYKLSFEEFSFNDPDNFFMLITILKKE